MKKITLCILLFVAFWKSNAQTCTQTFTATGYDSTPTSLIINAADLICYGANPITSIKLVNSRGSLASGFCSSDATSWYGFNLSIDGGTSISGCSTVFDGTNITGFSTLTITSQDDDAWPDSVTITIDVEVTFTALTPPSCVSLTLPTNGAVGVLSNVITWPAASGGAIGYKLKIGTTSGGSDVLNMFDVGNVLTYNLGVLIPGTTYYVSVIPYNANGDATACTESLFTTCGANPVPASENFSTYIPSCWQEADNGDEIAGPLTFGSSSWAVDGFANNGTTGAFKYNVYSLVANDWILSPIYSIPSTGYELKFDAAATQWGSASSPTTPWESDDSIQVLISNGTSNWTVLYTFNDLNTPSNTGTTNVLNLSAYSGQNVRFAFRAIEGTSNGSADIDFSIDNFIIRLTPTCSEVLGLVVNNITPTSANINWTPITSGSLNYEYELDSFATNPTGSGTSISTATYSASLLMPNMIYYFHIRSNCGNDFSPWSTISFTTPPSNDNCSGATALTPGGDFTTNPQTGTILAATTTAGITPSCQSTVSADVWYSVVVPASGTITIETQSATTNALTDSVIVAFSGTCGALTEVGCSDDDVIGLMSLLALTGQTAGATLYVGVWKYGTTAPTSTNSGFQIAAYDASLSTNSFNSAAFTYYPNPVKNTLNLSYSENISDVSVYNLLGQQVIAKAINANQSQIDMSNLASGAYVVKVTANNQVKTIKVIKE